MSERVYAIIPTTEIAKVNFDEILQTSEETLRYSLDESKAVIKWSEDDPSFIKEIVGAEGPYSHLEILVILDSDEWTDKSTFPILG
jgi:hypothetical protein